MVLPVRLSFAATSANCRTAGFSDFAAVVSARCILSGKLRSRTASADGNGERFSSCPLMFSVAEGEADCPSRLASPPFSFASPVPTAPPNAPDAPPESPLSSAVRKVSLVNRFFAASLSPSAASMAMSA